VTGLFCFRTPFSPGPTLLLPSEDILHLGKQSIDARYSLSGDESFGKQASKSVMACTKTTTVSRIIFSSARSTSSQSGSIALLTQRFPASPTSQSRPNSPHGCERRCIGAIYRKVYVGA
jgi:hypothetical protein